MTDYPPVATLPLALPSVGQGGPAGIPYSSSHWRRRVGSLAAAAALHGLALAALLVAPQPAPLAPVRLQLAVRTLELPAPSRTETSAPVAEPQPAPISPAPRPEPVQSPVPPPVPAPALSSKATPKPKSNPQPARTTAKPAPGAAGRDASSVSPAQASLAAAAPAGTPLVEPRFDAAYLRNPPPAYPPQSRRQGEEGKVLLRVRVSADGQPEAVEISQGSGFPRLDAAARDAVRRWRFLPARRGNEPVAAAVLVPVLFRLDAPS